MSIPSLSGEVVSIFTTRRNLQQDGLVIKNLYHFVRCSRECSWNLEWRICHEDQEIL